MDQIDAQGVSTTKADRGADQSRASNRWPDFFVIGAAKAGTTTLHDYLSRHPSLWMSKVKEPRFFCPDPPEGFEGARFGSPIYPKDVSDLESYHKLFEGADKTQLCGESSVDYSMWPGVPDVPRNIHAVAPNARFIYLLRDPIKRCYSHFVFRHSRILSRGQPFQKTFKDFIEQDPRIVYPSDYAAQIRQYLEYFPKESLLLLSFERFCKEPAWSLRQVFEFLGVEDRSEELAREPIHNNSIAGFSARLRRDRILAPFRSVPGLQFVYRRFPQSLRRKSFSLLENSFIGRKDKRKFAAPPLTPETQKLLSERFAPSTEYLEREFGFDTSWWR